jgi:hypothetical protein
MTPSPPSDDRDPASAYADVDPDAVRAARPPEPSEAAWEEMRLGIHERLAASRAPRNVRRVAVWAAAGVGAALATAAAVIALIVFRNPPVEPPPSAPDVARTVPVAPLPHEVQPDPLAEFAVLPMASSDEVVLHRVPGDGFLPIGEHPLPGMLLLATSSEVELDDPNDAWPNATSSPDRAPMIFAAKPR